MEGNIVKVIIVESKDLPDNIENPFVTVTLSGQKKSTRIIYRKVNPIGNEELNL